MQKIHFGCLPQTMGRYISKCLPRSTLKSQGSKSSKFIDLHELNDMIVTTCMDFQLAHHSLLRVLTHLGSGEFGTVNKGKWNHGAEQKDVALKMLKSDASPQDGVKFLQEAAINGQFHHENIVQLYGVVTIGNPVCTMYKILSVICIHVSKSSNSDIFIKIGTSL